MTTDREPALGRGDNGIEGRVAVDIRCETGKVSDITVTSSRPLGAASVLEGRGLADAVASLRLLYSLCGTAHTVAGLTAAEAALGVDVDADVAMARRVMVAGEALGQLLWRLMLDLPQTAGEETAFDALRDARARLARLSKAVYPRADGMRIGGAGAAPDSRKLLAFAGTMDEIAALGLYGETDKPAEMLRDPDRFAIWVARAETPIARVLRQVSEHGWNGFGAHDIAPLPDLTPSWFVERLAGTGGRQFAAMPDVDGTARETGALARHRDHPLLKALIADHGAGLLAQIAAKLVDADALIAEIRAFGEGAAPEMKRCASPKKGSGVACVETARGLLVHALEIADEKTVSYRILAPTEWNFHPGGPLVRGLLGETVEETNVFHEAANLLVTAIDPCVQFDITLGSGQNLTISS